MSKEDKLIRDAKQTELTFYDDGRGYYVPSDFASQQNIKRMKEEYTRLRDIARKRIKYLREKGLFSESYADKMFEKIPKISEMYAESNGSMDIFKVELASALSDVSKMLNKGATTVKRATDRNEKLKADFERDWAYLKQWADRSLPGALDNIDPSTINIEGFYDLMDYYKDQNSNFNYWTGRELKELFGLDYQSDIVDKTPQYYLDRLFNKVAPTPENQIVKPTRKKPSTGYDKSKHRYTAPKKPKKG